jgi:hypothetical protein
MGGVVAGQPVIMGDAEVWVREPYQDPCRENQAFHFVSLFSENINQRATFSNENNKKRPGF